MILNPEAVGDPNQTPVVYLGPGAAEVLGIRQRAAEMNLAAWCRARAMAFRDFEDHEMAMWPDEVDRDTGIVEWVIKVLANVTLPESAAVLQAIAEERARRDPLSVCEFCGAALADPTALCPNPSCQSATSERDSVMAGLVGKELDD